MLLTESSRSLRQAAAEILAIAVLELFPTAKLVGGGATRTGFGYHFVFEQAPTEREFPQIQEAMSRIIRAKKAIVRREMLRDNAAEMMRATGQPIRAERILTLPVGLVDVFEVEEFRDVASAPFPTTTALVGAFSLLHLEAEPEGGVYIGGVAFASTEELKRYRRIESLEKKWDHRKLGPELGLFHAVGKGGAALWMWSPQGQIVREELLNFWSVGMRRMGCSPVTTSAIYREDFLRELGAVAHPIFDSYAASEQLDVGHALLFQSVGHSYRDLPLGYSECRNHWCLPEGGAFGLARSREQWIDQASFFCTSEQLCKVVALPLQFILQGLNMLGFEHRIRLVGHGPQAEASRREWEKAESELLQVLTGEGLEYEVVAAERRTSGPALEVLATDAIGRTRVASFVRIELDLPRRLELRFQNGEGQMSCPSMVTCSVFGSLESFIGILLEHFYGEFPLWLSPEQVRILPVKEEHRSQAQRLLDSLKQQGVRTSIDARAESLGARVRLAQLARVPYTVVIGDEEQAQNQVAVRCRSDGKVRRLGIDDWIVELKQEIETKALGGRIPRN